MQGTGINYAYILPLRFSDAEIKYLTATRKKVLPNGEEFVLTHDPKQHVAVIFTKLVQSIRLQRELRLLQLSSSCVIYQVSSSSDMIEQSAPQITLQPWCVYQPEVLNSRTTEGNISAILNSNLNVLINHVRGSVSHSTTTRVGNSARQSSESLKQSNAQPYPSLLRHESTTDVSSKNSYDVLDAHPRNAKYACQRRAPLVCANEALANQLHLMRLARILQGDWIGERAYSSALASIRAADQVIRSSADLNNLEGCGKKIVELIGEWLSTGKMRELEDTWASSDMNVLLSFWNCHGVGAVTARGGTLPPL